MPSEKSTTVIAATDSAGVANQDVQRDVDVEWAPNEKIRVKMLTLRRQVWTHADDQLIGSY